MKKKSKFLVKPLIIYIYFHLLIFGKSPFYVHFEDFQAFHNLAGIAAFYQQIRGQIDVKGLSPLKTKGRLGSGRKNRAGTLCFWAQKELVNIKGNLFGSPSSRQKAPFDILSLAGSTIRKLVSEIWPATIT